MQIEVPRLSWEQLQTAAGEDSATVRERVIAARGRQHARGFLNAHLPLKQLDRVCSLGVRQRQTVQKAMNRFQLSPRSLHRILKVARTIADLHQSDTIDVIHLQEAIGYRCLEKNPGSYA